MILEDLHDDKETLLQCSLVCKAWVPSTSKHLFQSFNWPPCNGSSRFNCICPSQHPEEAHIPTFEILLLSLPRVCASMKKLYFGKHHVHCLEHFGLADRSSIDALINPNAQTLANFAALMQALTLFPRLSHLDIRAHFDEAIPQPSEPHLSLAELKINLMVKTSIDPVLAFLTSFRRIDTLSFEFLVYRGNDAASMQMDFDSFTPPTITSLGMAHVDFLEVNTPAHLNPLRSVLDLNSLQVLELRHSATHAMLQQMDCLNTLRIGHTPCASAIFCSRRYPHNVPTKLGMILVSCYLGPCQQDTSIVYSEGADWETAMRDLQGLANETTTSLFIEVSRDTDGDTDSFSSRGFFHRLRGSAIASVDRLGGALEALEWELLEHVLCAYPSLNHLELHFYHDLRASRDKAADLPERAKQCVQLLERIARRRLSARVLGRIAVTVRVTIDEGRNSSAVFTEAITIT